MLKNLIAKAIATVQGIGNTIVGRLEHEPVLILTALSIGLEAFKSAQAGGLTIADAAFAATAGVLGYFTRQLVWPAVKVNVDGALAEPAPAKPFIPGDES